MTTLRGKEYVKFECFVSKEKFPYEKEVTITVRYEKGTFYDYKNIGKSTYFSK